MKEEISQGVNFYGKLIPPSLNDERRIPLLGAGKSLGSGRKNGDEDAVSLVCWLECVLVSGLQWKKRSARRLV